MKKILFNYFFNCESESERKRGFVVNRGFVDGWKYEDKGW